VRNIGLWSGTPGTLQFNNVSVPGAGAYQLTVHYMFVNGQTDPRLATIRINDNTMITATFPGPGPCCEPREPFLVTLRQGVNIIHIGNDTGPAPSIDKIVISRP
jgi:alpha-galactosidase